MLFSHESPSQKDPGLFRVGRGPTLTSWLTRGGMKCLSSASKLSLGLVERALLGGCHLIRQGSVKQQRAGLLVILTSDCLMGGDQHWASQPATCFLAHALQVSAFFRYKENPSYNHKSLPGIWNEGSCAELMSSSFLIRAQRAVPRLDTSKRKQYRGLVE